MEELKYNETSLMSEEEFKEYISKCSQASIKTYGVSTYKSMSRAIKRGHIAPDGTVYPKRPFNNRANTSNRKVNSRTLNNLKQNIYKEYVQR